MNIYFSRIPEAAIQNYFDGRQYAYIPHCVAGNSIVENFDMPLMIRFDGGASFIKNGEAYVQFAKRGDAVPLQRPYPFGVTVHHVDDFSGGTKTID